MAALANESIWLDIIPQYIKNTHSPCAVLFIFYLNDFLCFFFTIIMCFCYNYKNNHKVLYGTIHVIQSENPNNKEAMKEECPIFLL